MYNNHSINNNITYIHKTNKCSRGYLSSITRSIVCCIILCANICCTYIILNVFILLLVVHIHVCM